MAKRRVDFEPSARRLVLIEGIPGAGKTRTARRVDARLAELGVPVRWYLEELAQHPVSPRSLLRLHPSAGFADACLESWRSFVRRGPAGVDILEGTLFQSTVRFLYARGDPECEVRGYVAELARIVSPLEPVVVYLQPPDPEEHLRSFVPRVKGPEWVARVTAYGSRTPLGRRRGWEGLSGLVDFWSGYRQLCDSLVAALPFPRLDVTVEPDGWPAREREILAWIETRV